MNASTATILPPGTQLRLMYVEERLKPSRPGHFIEIGPGNGDITWLLLDLGWTGHFMDLEAITVQRLQARFADEIAAGRYTATVGDYVVTPPDRHMDLVISCMVMEHLDSEAESAFMQRSAEWLKPQGRMIGLVLGSPAHWGIEDDIAGHCRCYMRADVAKLASKTGRAVDHLSGVTYTHSNMLLSLSNHLVRKSEAEKLRLPDLEKAKQTGHLYIKHKTHLSAVLGWFANRHPLLPAYLLQKLLRYSEKALVLYFEARPLKKAVNNA